MQATPTRVSHPPRYVTYGVPQPLPLQHGDLIELDGVGPGPLGGLPCVHLPDGVQIPLVAEDNDRCLVEREGENMSVNETACEYIHMYMHVGHPSAADLAWYWSCTLGGCLTSRPKGCSWPRELWFSIYSCMKYQYFL